VTVAQQPQERDQGGNLRDDDEPVALLARRTDDAADVLAELPGPRRRALMEALPERQRRRISTLAGDEPATAGSLMSTSFLACYSDATVRMHRLGVA
jgi:Mg/Co/Ni transporter MgtE